MDAICRFCGALHWLAERTSNSSKRSPKFGTCCNHGKVILPPLHEPPPALRGLLTAQDSEAKEFREHIREYNSALSFTSLGVKPDKSILNGRGPYVFRLHGVLYHLSGSLLPEPGDTPKYAQLYIHDPQSALNHRMTNNPDRSPTTMQLLQTMLRSNHRYAAVYKQAYEILAEYPDADEASIQLRVDPSRDRRRYNLPTVDEVAIIIPGDGSQAKDNRDIILRNRHNRLQRVSDAHPAYCCLRYVLLFPHGEHGWHYDVQSLSTIDEGDDSQDQRRITQTRYYAYQLHTRSGEFSIIHRSGRLFQEWLVDMWASADQNRLTYLRQNQDKLRASVYSGLEDAISAADNSVDLNELGQRFILPSSYIGGARHMYQRFQDAMAIARYYRKVDLFITITANGNTPEVQRELLPGQHASERPDLVSRVFKLKLEEAIDDIYKHGIFGHAAAYVYVVEFQKRGFPHGHLLIVLKEPYKLLTPVDVDSVIRAYWPDPETEPKLFDTVKRVMVHGPCGAYDPGAPCMVDGKCSKGFPKQFQPHTSMDKEGYPKYYRPDDGRAYEVNKHMLDNRWIVPYNPYMLAKYDCHINVECVASIAAIKYPFKYIHKGGDRASAELRHRDEITDHIDGRYIASPEATWRILHFSLHDQIPNVIRLQVHLPGQHMVVFDPDDDPSIVQERAENEQTTLTAFFAANSDGGALGELARTLTYQEFPQKMVLKEKSRSRPKRWEIRQKGFALGRMYFASPLGGERFYLRTLLTVARGPRSFAELRTVDGIQYPTFRDACIARGLLEDDGEWQLCLREASLMHTGSLLRQLFAIMLLFCNPAKPEQLWAEFREHLCDDLARRLSRLGVEQPSADDVYDYGLYLIDTILKQSRYSLSDNFPSMPTPQEDWDRRTGNHFIAEQLDYDRERELASAAERVAMMNAKQREAFEKIIESAMNKLGKIFFLNGPGGTGKTFVYNTVCHKLRGEGLIVLCVASSGIAALLLKGGRTSHSMFKIPVDGLTNETFCSIPKQGLLAELLRRADVTIWDEITMQHKLGPEAVDRTLRDIRNVPDKPFGGMTVVFGGDFQQILPVVVKGTKEEIVEASIQRSHLWQGVEILRLQENMRLRSGSNQDSNEREFASWLLDVGHGRAGGSSDGTVRLREGMQSPTLDSLIHSIYPQINSSELPPPEYFMRRMILAARNGDVDAINEDVLGRMPGRSKIYVSADSVVSEAGADGPDTHANDIPVEFLRSLTASGLPPGELTLKPGCPLILLRNLAPAQGLCNGTRMTLLRMSERVLEVRLLGGDHDGETAFIPRISLTPSSGANFAFMLRRRQFPVRLAFALTINKSQGQSVEFVGLDLRVPVFAHGQLYVALSRATSGNRVKVLLADNLADNHRISDIPDSTPNVVYPEVLLD
jgi:hypothetical protein